MSAQNIEVIEFFLPGISHHFGVRVGLVRQILEYKPELFTRIPRRKGHALPGFYLFRREPVRMIDPAVVMKLSRGLQPEMPLVLVLEIKGENIAFPIDGVSAMHKCPADNLQLPLDFPADCSRYFLDIMTVNEHDVTVIDFEKMVADLDRKEENPG